PGGRRLGSGARRPARHWSGTDRMAPRFSTMRRKPSRAKDGSGMGSAHEYDVIVVGSGIAGLFGASSSYLAQGGVAAATRLGDSLELHARDTLRAGRGLSRSSAVEVLTQEAPARI